MAKPGACPGLDSGSETYDWMSGLFIVKKTKSQKTKSSHFITQDICLLRYCGSKAQVPSKNQTG